MGSVGPRSFAQRRLAGWRRCEAAAGSRRAPESVRGRLRWTSRCIRLLGVEFFLFPLQPKGIHGSGGLRLSGSGSLRLCQWRCACGQPFTHGDEASRADPRGSHEGVALRVIRTTNFFPLRRKPKSLCESSGPSINAEISCKESFRTDFPSTSTRMSPSCNNPVWLAGPVQEK